MEWIDLVASRPVVIALACAGALLTLLGNDAVAQRARLAPRIARLIIRTGYALMWLSIALFIVAGFLAAYA